MSGPERFKVPIGIFIMLRQDDKVLLQLRQNCSFSGYWGFVGGHLDGNEQIVSAAIREAKEEIGVDISPEDLTLKTIVPADEFYAIEKPKLAENELATALVKECLLTDPTLSKKISKYRAPVFDYGQFDIPSDN